MTKADLIEHIYGAKEFRGAVSKKTLAALVDAVFAEVQKALRKDGRFSYPNFGTFLRKKRAGRTGRNPKTQERIRIAPRQTVTFKPHQAFKDALNPRAR